MKFNTQDMRKLEQQVENKIAFELNREIKRNAPVDKGQLRADYTVVESTGHTNALIRNTTPHAGSQEYGTVPFTPPLRPLKAWGERVLGSQSAGAAVWQKIREQGISPQPHVRPAIDKIRAKY